MKRNEKNYETPYLEVVIFQEDDVITMSDGTTNEVIKLPEVEYDGY